MHFVAACDTSSLSAAVNYTGVLPIMGIRLTNHRIRQVVWCVQRETFQHWEVVDGMCDPSTLDAVVDAWRPVVSWPRSYLARDKKALLDASLASFYTEAPPARQRLFALHAPECDLAR